MTLESFRAYCLAKKAVTEEFPFDEETLVYKVMGKMFALANSIDFASINLKCDPEKAIELREQFDALGYIHDETAHTPLFRSMGDTWYKMHFTGANPCGAGNPMYFVWTVPDAHLQSNYDESWGLDNVVVKTDN